MKNLTFFKRLFLFVCAFALIYSVQAQSIDKLEQYANGALKDALMVPSISSENTDWVTGNVNAAKAHYACGMTIPYRLQISDLEPDITYHVTIGYDITKGYKHAIDFLTSFNRDTNHDKFNHVPEDVLGEILDGTVLEGMVTNNPANYDEWPLPAPIGNDFIDETGYEAPIGTTVPPSTDISGWTKSVADGWGNFRIYNGIITGLTLSTGDPTGDTESEYLTVDFQVVTEQSAVVLTWGGNIACCDLWGEGSSAADINGSPYHMYIESCSGLSGCGNKEVQLSATAVIDIPPPVCEVEATPNECVDATDGIANVTVTDGTEPYEYLWESFYLDGTPTGATYPNTDQITGLPPGIYEVTVTDANDATTSCRDTILAYPEPKCSVDDFHHETKMNRKDGWAKVTVTEGTPDYSYFWYTPDITGITFEGQGTDSIYGLAGDPIGLRYEVDITDANGCTTTCDVLIFRPAADAPHCEVVTTDATCDGYLDGSATGPNPITDVIYEWFKMPNEATVIGTTQGITNLDSGQYKLVLTDTITLLSATCFGDVSDWDPVILTCPGDQLETTCQEQSVINGKFDDWMASVSVTGRDALLTTDWDSLITSYPDACGDTITVTWTLHDECADPNSCSATFMIPAPAAVTLTAPANDTLDACLAQTDVNDAFTSWLAEVDYTLGCNGQINDDNTGAPDACGGKATVTWKVTSDCEGTKSASAVFVVPNKLDYPVITLPEYQDYFCIDYPGSLIATWVDDCSSGRITAQPVLDVEASSECEEIYTYTFTASDDCGHSTTEVITVTRNWESLANCETSYARLDDDLPDQEEFTDEIGARCFENDGFSRWGWVNRIKVHPDSIYTMNVYAGAAQCDYENNGYFVGTVVITFAADVSTMNLDFTLIDNWLMGEAHVYVGTDMYPVLTKGKKTTPTVAPGQYTLVYEGQEPIIALEVDVTNMQLTDYAYVIVHGVTCQPHCACIDTEYGDLFQTMSMELPAKPIGKKKSEIEPAELLKGDFKVYPNPFSHKVNFDFVSSDDVHAVLDIYSITGQKIRTLFDKQIEGGVLNTVEYIPESDVSGIYIYRLTLDNTTQVGRVIYKK